MFNPQMLIQRMQGGELNPQNLLSMFGGNPMFQQAQKWLQSGGNPQEIIKNVAKQKGIDANQLQEMAKQFGVKL